MTAIPCKHWWLLEPPSAETGGMVGAACRYCGATRTFNPPNLADRDGGYRPLSSSDRKVAERVVTE